MWGHGGTTSAGDPAHDGDLDTYVVVSRRPDKATAGRIEEAHAATAQTHGVTWDAWYVLEKDAGHPEPPPHAWSEDRRDTSWAIHRAHWLAGQFVNLHGREPADIVPRPTWDDQLRDIDRELEHIERHIVEGDTDPYEATYAVLTGTRILHAMPIHNVAISKRSAGTWGLEHLPVRWHAAIRAAVRTYDGEGSDADAHLLATEMAAFVTFVREHLPPTTHRPAGALPRWSGY